MSISHFIEKFYLGVWNVGIIERKAEELMQSDNNNLTIRWMKHSYRDRFFADPFLYDADKENYYLLVEEYPFWTNIGFISLLTVNRETMQIKKKEKLITSSYHLSYPFPYKGFVIPECYTSNKCVGYRVVDGKITSIKEFAQFGLIDQTFLEYDGYEWVFATDKDNPLAGLKIFYRKRGTEDWIPHKKNPVSQDITTARPGGHFFMIGDSIYRPVQDSERLYGHQIHIMRVDLLNTEDYRETIVKTFSSENNPPFSMGFHTFNVEDGFIVVDGYREYCSMFVKPICVIFWKLKHIFNKKYNRE